MSQDVKMQFTWALAQDKASVLVEINNSRSGAAADIVLDAHDLDNVMQNLAQARSQMTPAFPRDLDPKPVFRNLVSGGTFHISAGATPPENKAKITFGVLHPGFGWMAFQLSPDDTIKLATIMATKANEATVRGVKLVRPDGRPLA